MNKYDIAAERYNYTRTADKFIAGQIEQLLLPQKELNYLDIGCGTGNYTIKLYDRGINIQGIDPSEAMLTKAKEKSAEIIWTAGYAEQLPFADNYFSGAIATLTVHHWSNLADGFLEVYRNLKPGGKFVIFTATQEQMRSYWLCHYFPKMMEKSIGQMPAYNTLVDKCTAAGFVKLLEKKYFIQDDLEDLFLYSGKNKPDLYLDQNIRENISSFKMLGNQSEIQNGLKMLTSDLTDENFEKVKRLFDDQSGDYLFLQFQKQ